jgi:hypothetical protein
MNWNGKRVTLYSKWGDGGNAFLVAPNGRNPEFTLNQSPIRNCAYLVSYSRGYMHECWYDCEPLVEMGTEDPPAITDFPELVPCDPNIDRETQKALAPVLAELAKNDTNIKRIEGFMDVVYQGQKVTDRVRMTYLTGVVPVRGGAEPEDLVVIWLSYKDGGGPQEDGGASGPPKD